MALVIGIALAACGPWGRTFSALAAPRQSVGTASRKAPLCYEVRYKDTSSAERAVAELHGSFLGQEPVQVTLNKRFEPITKVNVQGISWDTPEDEVLEHFQSAGPVEQIKSQEDLRYGEVRFRKADDAWKAKTELDGSELYGKRLRVELDCSTDYLNKVLVHGISGGVQWQELKDHFKPVGEIVFSAIHGGREAIVAFADIQGATRAMKTLNRSRLYRDQMSSIHVCRPWEGTEDSAEVRVRNLPYEVPIDDVVRHFKRAGRVVSVTFVPATLPPEFCVPTAATQ